MSSSNILEWWEYQHKGHNTRDPQCPFCTPDNDELEERDGE